MIERQINLMQKGNYQTDYSKRTAGINGTDLR